MRKQVSPSEYITTVLKDWKEFCKGHRLFEKALVEILEENARLKKEINLLKSGVKNG